jgi:hypothetical protein
LPDQTWEIALPNGRYRVALRVGDVPHPSQNTINIEGTNFCSDLSLPRGTRTLTHTVEIRDGRPTLDTRGATDRLTKVCSLTITPDP